jgi:hypothetical protein
MTILTRSLILFASGVIAFAQAGAQVELPAGETLAAGIVPVPAYTPITAGQRFRWIVNGTLGAPNLAAGAVLASVGTATNSPKEYGPHWDGFGKRYGLRLAGGATSQVLEASIGSMWGEDPRYFRTTGGQSFKTRLGHVAKMTFLSTNRNGETMPAYARYIAIPSTQFISNAWRPDSQATVNSALTRIPFGFLSSFTSRAFSEFWPDLKGRITGNKN